VQPHYPKTGPNSRSCSFVQEELVQDLRNAKEKIDSNQRTYTLLTRRLSIAKDNKSAHAKLPEDIEQQIEKAKQEMVSGKEEMARLQKLVREASDKRRESAENADDFLGRSIDDRANSLAVFKMSSEEQTSNERVSSRLGRLKSPERTNQKRSTSPDLTRKSSSGSRATSLVKSRTSRSPSPATHESRRRIRVPESSLPGDESGSLSRTCKKSERRSHSPTRAAP
jgi:hypothetical protein